MSVRCKNYDPPLDLAAYEGIKLRVLGNGLRYKCIIRVDSSWDGVGYCRCDWAEGGGRRGGGVGRLEVEGVGHCSYVSDWCMWVGKKDGGLRGLVGQVDSRER